MLVAQEICGIIITVPVHSIFEWEVPSSLVYKAYLKFFSFLKFDSAPCDLARLK